MPSGVVPGTAVSHGHALCEERAITEAIRTRIADGKIPMAEGRALVADFIGYGGRRLGAAIALMLAGGVLEGVGLALLVPIFSLLAPHVEGPASGHWRMVAVAVLSRFGLVTPTAQLGAVLLAFCMLVGVRAIVLSARDRLVSDLTLGFVDHRRLLIVADLAQARWPSLARLRHARIGHILSSEIPRLAFACSTVMGIMMASIMLVIQASLVVLLSPIVAALMIGFALLGLAALVPLSRRAADVGKSSARFSFRIAGEAAQFLGGLKIAVAHDMADAFVAQIAEESAKLRALHDGQLRFQSRVSIVSASLSSLVGAAMIFGAVMLGVPTITLLAAVVIVMRMSGPVRALQVSAQQMFGVLPAFTALRDLKADLGEGARPASGEGAGAGERPAPRGAIRFEQVGFRYPDAPAPVFVALDLTIAPGEMVGLAGPSGTGKTSFVDLLTGLLDPTEGRILIGDQLLDADTLAGWRRQLAYVAQDSYLINDSIRRNLTWRLPLPDADLWDALAQAGATDLVAAMPEGLDTKVDERGTRLSGGERQRIALARAMLRDPALLILDEATNAIDVVTEQAVIANLRRVLPETTILVIAHREETLRACDRVIVLGTPQMKRPTSASAGSTG